MKMLLFLTLITALSPAICQTFDAEGNRIDPPPAKPPINADAYAVQNRNAAVLQGLVDQTIEYQPGYSAEKEVVKNRQDRAYSYSRRSR